MSTAVRVLGGTGLVLAIAAVLTLRLLDGVLSDPDRRSDEWLIMIPFGLGASAVALLAAALAILVIGTLWRWWRWFTCPPRA